MNPGLNFNNLKYFYDAVEAESISEAARRNFLTQSAVSQGIQKLEKALNVSLITHQRNCFKLTPEGHIIFSLTQQLFKTIKTMTEVTQELQDTVSGQINVVCTQSIAMNLIATVLQKLKQEYPQVSVKMKIGKMENLSLLLKRGSMDLGIVVESELCDQFDRHLIRKGVFQVYAKEGEIRSVEEGIHVDHSNGLYVDRLHNTFLKKFGKNLTILQELDSWQVLAKCAENNIGYCFLPDFLLNDDSSMRACETLAPIPYKIVAIHPKGAHLTRAAKTFIDFLSKENLNYK